LPASLRHLKFLRRLDLSRNKLGSLALIEVPSQAQTAEVLRLAAEADEFEEMRIQGEIVYVNKRTCNTLRQAPDSLKGDPWETLVEGDAERDTSKPTNARAIRDAKVTKGALVPALNLSGVSKPAPVLDKLERQRVIERRKRVLISRGLGEWSVESDFVRGCAVYCNNIFRTQRDDMPSTLDLFGELVQLQALVLSDNHIQDLPPSFAKLASLTDLDLSCNKLAVVPDCVFAIPKLVRLNVSENVIEYLSPRISELVKLQDLNLSSNKLPELPPELGSVMSLRIVNVSNNNITWIPTTIIQLTNLKEFIYVANPIESPTKEALATCKTLPDLLYQLRQIDLRAEHGPEPVLVQASYGIGGERNDTDANYFADQEKLMARAAETHVLHIHHRSIVEIPHEAYYLRIRSRCYRMTFGT
jgi:hypothetical protein